MNNPCVKECPDRFSTCHATCEKYKAYADWCEEQRNQRHWQRKKREHTDHYEKAFRNKILRKK